MVETAAPSGAVGIVPSYPGSNCRDTAQRRGEKIGGVCFN